MGSRLTRIVQRSLLLTLTLFGLVITPHLYATSTAVAQQATTVLSQTITAQPQQQAVVAVDSVGFVVADMDRAIAFYSDVLPFKKVSDLEVLGSDYENLQGLFGVRMRIVQLQLGDELLELTEYLTPKGRPIPIDSRSNDHWFQHIAIVVSDMDQAYDYLRQHKVQYTSTAPQQIPDWNKAAAGIRAFYFKDSDGHNLEIIYFPPGKGNPKWQRSTNQLFLGIDHTAIVVANTAKSLTFYRDLLGLKLAGESTNYGIEQAHLNNVKNARLHISGLRTMAGPGIEFLEYLHPTDGRSLPADTQPNDLVHWQTTLVVKDLAAMLQRLGTYQTPLISNGIVTFTDLRLGFQAGLLVRDPTGHAIRLVEK